MTSEEPAFKIKTSNLPLLQLHINTTDMVQLKEQLMQRLSQTPDFFANTPIVLELSGIAQSDEELNFAELMSFMLEHSMCAAGVLGGSEAQRVAAVKRGLGLFPDVPVRNPMRRATDDVLSVTGRHAPVIQTQLFPPEVTLPPVTPVTPVPPVAIVRPTMVVDKPVRAGQRIYAEGANLVVLAIVNAGAELIADGDIHVYAPMRGKAIAGARGNEDARIFVQSLEAELLSIAGCFKVFEDGIPENVHAKPAQVHLEGSRLLISSLLY